MYVMKKLKRIYFLNEKRKSPRTSEIVAPLRHTQVETEFIFCHAAHQILIRRVPIKCPCVNYKLRPLIVRSSLVTLTSTDAGFKIFSRVLVRATYILFFSTMHLTL